MEATERAIRDAVAAGDIDRALTLLFAAHRDFLWAWVRRHVPEASVEEIIQDTMEATLIALRKGRYQGKQPLIAFVLGIARFKAYHLRDSWWQKVLQGAVGEDDLTAPTPAAADEWGVPHDADVEQVLAAFDARDRILGTMVLEGMTFKQIGRCLGISENSAAQRYSRAIRKVRAARRR